MRVTTVGNEKDMGELVGRLYGRISKAKSAAAAEALAKANPQLGAAPKRGAVLVVPDELDLPLSQQAEVGAPAGVLEQGAVAAVAAFSAHLSAAAKVQADRAAAEAKLLKTAQIKHLVKEMPALQEHATRVAEETTARQTQAKLVRDIAAKGFAIMGKAGR